MENEYEIKYTRNEVFVHPTIKTLIKRSVKIGIWVKIILQFRLCSLKVGITFLF